MNQIKSGTDESGRTIRILSRKKILNTNTKKLPQKI